MYAAAHGVEVPQTAGLENTENTWTAMIDASLAMPEKLCAGTAFGPLPAAMPATWVPWKQSSGAEQGAAAPVPVCVSCPFGHAVVALSGAKVLEKQASWTTLPARNG